MRFKEPEVSSGKRLARAQYSSMLSSIKERKRAFLNIKQQADYSELCISVDFLESKLHPKFRGLLYGNALPNDYSNLGVCEYSYTDENIVHEINWILIGVRKYAKEIRQFLDYKEDYERNLLIGNYGLAETILMKIESEVCHSLWSLENRFLIKEYMQSSLDNKDFLSQFNEQNQSLFYTRPLAHYLSLRAEKTLSVNRFKNDLDLTLSKLSGRRKEEHKDYYSFKLSFINNNDFKKFPHIIAYDFQHSIIDRYLNLVNVLSNLLAYPKSIANNPENGINIKLYLLNRLDYLIRKTSDKTLIKLRALNSPAINSMDPTKQDCEFVELIDKYTLGYYEEVEIETKKLLTDYPLSFDIYILYVNSLIHQKKDISSITNAKTIQNEILIELFKLTSGISDPSQSSSNLLRIANNIASCNLSYSLVDYVQRKTKDDYDRIILGKLSYNTFNPINSDIYRNAENKTEHLNRLKTVFPSSKTIDFLSQKVSGIRILDEFKKYLPEIKFKQAQAETLQSYGEFEGAALIWEDLLKQKDVYPIFESAVKNLYACYEVLNEYNRCIKLIVDSFLTNLYIVERINVKPILKKIRESRFKIVAPTIDLPIFYTIARADENEIHTAFEKFNLTQGVTKPSELLTIFNKFDPEKIIFFLKHTSGLETLKHSIHINGSKERLEERLSICSYLKNIDLDDKNYYNDEIKYISNILIIQKGLLELDESKIYVNEQGIISTELKEYESVFVRFQTISGIENKKKKLYFDFKGRLTTVNYTEEETEVEKIVYSSNPVFDLYKELFDAIKDKFLHSKFGIVAYLSTRIRHGVLLGELRPIFEKHKLITLKDSNSSSYRRNYNWDNIYRNENIITQDNVQSLLKEFSLSVDGLIFDLIKKYLQVNDKEYNKDGWFDYHFDDENIFWHSIRAIKSKDFYSFSQRVFEILWDKTDSNLNLIRDKIQNDIARLFEDLFNKLEKDVVDLLGTYKSQALLTAIKLCSTETQSAITRISSWFKRSGTSASDFYLENLIDIVMEYTNKTNHHKQIILERDIQYNCKIKGEYLTHFADLLRIFTENILKHADDKVSSVNAKISSQCVQDSILVIEVSNEITNRDSVDALKSVWVNDEIIIDRLLNEGKSGYHKALKILRSDLQSESNFFTTLTSEDDEDLIVQLLIETKNLLA